MNIPERLRSRKLWVTIVALLAPILSDQFGIDISEEALLGMAGIVIAYLGGQSWVDKSTAQATAEIAKDQVLSQASAYIKYLESQLAAVGAQQPPAD